MSAFYTIDWSQFIIDNLPIEQQKPIIIRWLNLVFKPIVRLHKEFLGFRSESLYKVNHNSQICYLQAVLNDSFDKRARRIRISNAKLKEPLWFYEPLEDKPVYFREDADEKPVYFREETDFLGGWDFLVVLPILLKPSDVNAENDLIIRIKAQINYYKLFVKEPKIIFEEN
jgi:hypothetical protein